MSLLPIKRILYVFLLLSLAFLTIHVTPLIAQQMELEECIEFGEVMLRYPESWYAYGEEQTGFYVTNISPIETDSSDNLMETTLDLGEIYIWGLTIDATDDSSSTELNDIAPDGRRYQSDRATTTNDAGQELQVILMAIESEPSSEMFVVVYAYLMVVPSDLPEFENLVQDIAFSYSVGSCDDISADTPTDPNSPYGIALARIQEAQATGATRLDLSELGLTELPPEIGNLSNLTSLSVDKNELTTLPPEIGNLTNLRELRINVNRLNELPPEIGNLGNLRDISLLTNELSTLPPEIGNLSSLRSISLLGNPLSSLPPEIGNLTNLQLIWMSYNELHSLPPEIGNLSSLQRLVLNNNQLSELPPEIGNLSNLEILRLEANQLSSLPSEIGNLSSLQSLSLTWNELSSLPPEIGNLSNLQILSLSSNRLTSLPSEIGNLSNLQEFYLSNNQLSSLPPEIGNLSNLQMFSLGSNQFSTIPPEIFNLTNLQWLHLGNSQLSSLPPEIGNLSNLKSLDLTFNKLSNLPSEIFNLSSLQELWLDHNQLSSVLFEIFNLSNLQVLSLSNNQLSNLPSEVGDLSSLCYIDVRNNQIEYLPIELGQIGGFVGNSDCAPGIERGLLVDGNPLESPPPEIVEQGTEAILEYLQNQESDTASQDSITAIWQPKLFYDGAFTTTPTDTDVFVNEAEVIFINGIGNSPAAHADSLALVQNLPDFQDKVVIGIYNEASSRIDDDSEILGFNLSDFDPFEIRDLDEDDINQARDDLVQGIDGSRPLGTENQAVESLVTYLTEYKSMDDEVTIIVHSQAAAIVSAALFIIQRDYPDVRLDNLKIYTFGGFALNFPQGPMYNHCAFDADQVPLLAGFFTHTNVSPLRWSSIESQYAKDFVMPDGDRSVFSLVSDPSSYTDLFLQDAHRFEKYMAAYSECMKD